MASGFTCKVAGVDTDLDDVFEPRGITVPRADVGLTVAGADMALRYWSSEGDDQVTFSTGFLSAGADLKTLFRKKGWTPDAPTITSFTYDGPKYEGETIALAVAYTGSDVTSVVFRNPAGGALPSSGVTCLFTPSSYTQSGIYSVEVTNAGGTATHTLSVTVIEEVDPPVITSMSNTGPVFTGENVTCTCVATGADSYQWYKFGVLISGATGSTYTFTAHFIEDSGDYTCRVTNAGGSDSDFTEVNVNTPHAPHVTVTSDHSSYIAGQTAHFTATATGSGSLSYQWKHDGATIPSGTASTFSFDVTGDFDNGTYSCVVTSDYGSDSDSVTITTAYF